MLKKKEAGKDFIYRIAEYIDFPFEVVSHEPAVHMVRGQLRIEYVKKIVLFEENRIVFQTKQGLLAIEGLHLTIPFYSKECVLVKGVIQRVMLEENGKTKSIG